MGLKNAQIYGVQNVENGFASQKMTVDISATPRKTSVTGLYDRPQGRDKLLTRPVRAED